MSVNPFNSCAELNLGNTSLTYYRLRAHEEQGLCPSIDRLPYAIRVLLENLPQAF